MKALRKKDERGFTLIEIMIVVLIIGILLAIAVPNFVKARETSRAKACVSNLKQIDSAKEQWAMDTKAGDTDPGPLMTAIAGSGLYIKAEPECPSGGVYTIGLIGADPTCSIAATTTPPHEL
ncbi:MAG TPA: prepilin-type N-terminal cleavage/methylation domain-containing protein [Armatimonadota bacterium]|nr:prepilin-type N-terminal cleavage/methylation domain-containing protein [Armatimonadota bacterium]